MPRDNVESGDGQLPADTHCSGAVPTPSPAPDRGRPRKAIEATIPSPAVPSGAPHSQTPPHEAAGGGHTRRDAQGSCASPTTEPADCHPVGGGEERANPGSIPSRAVPALATPMPAV